MATRGSSYTAPLALHFLYSFVELHLHIEGSLEPEMLFDLGKRNAVTLPFANAAEVRQAYNFGSLQDFLDIYYQGMSVLGAADKAANLGG